jgi:hypothetical protein
MANLISTLAGVRIFTKITRRANYTSAFYLADAPTAVILDEVCRGFTRSL